MSVLVFDVETSGLFKEGNEPYITQLSYIVYDFNKKEITKVFDSYIQIPDNVVISDKITELTGVTRDKCNKGIPIECALKELYNDYHSVSVLIAHNYSFDSKMIKHEFTRNKEKLNNYENIDKLFTIPYLREKGMRYVCTMKETTDICKVPFPEKKQLSISTTSNEKKQREYKWPTLKELHKHLFDTEPVGLHNSLIDVYICLKCYLKYDKKYTMPDTDINSLL